MLCLWVPLRLTHLKTPNNNTLGLLLSYICIFLNREGVCCVVLGSTEAALRGSLTPISRQPANVL